MGIGVLVTKEDGGRLLELSDVRAQVPPPMPPADYVPLVSPGEWDRFPLLSGIDPYGVTIFNRRQSERLLLELDEVEVTADQGRRSLVRALRILVAEQHAGEHRQLRFIGD